MANPSLQSSTTQDDERPATNRGVTVLRIVGQHVDKKRSRILWMALGAAVLVSVLCDRIFIPSKQLSYRQESSVVAHCKRIAAVSACFFFPRLADVHSRAACGVVACESRHLTLVLRLMSHSVTFL
ncbi:hypothetical protein RSAG8_06009, partial [Rhizoctonia solani AG-8 WAC10335]